MVLECDSVWKTACFTGVSCRALLGMGGEDCRARILCAGTLFSQPLCRQFVF